jgi:hypothetical protein
MIPMIKVFIGESKYGNPEDFTKLYYTLTTVLTGITVVRWDVKKSVSANHKALLKCDAFVMLPDHEKSDDLNFVIGKGLFEMLELFIDDPKYHVSVYKSGIINAGPFHLIGQLETMDVDSYREYALVERLEWMDAEDWYTDVTGSVDDVPQDQKPDENSDTQEDLYDF